MASASTKPVPAETSEGAIKAGVATLEGSSSLQLRKDGLADIVFRPLKIGETAEGEVRQGQFQYYRLEHKDVSRMLTIHVEPCNGRSDPDLYVSNGTLPIATKYDYTWKSCLVGRDRVDVHPDDPHAKPGTYTIGVLGANMSVYGVSEEEPSHLITTAYKLSAHVSAPIYLTTLMPNEHHKVCIKESKKTVSSSTKSSRVEGDDTVAKGSDGATWRYFVHEVKSPKNSTVFVTCTPAHPDIEVSVYASNTVMFPDEQISRWRAKATGKPAQFKFDTDDYKHCKAKLCYVAVCASSADGCPLRQLAAKGGTYCQMLVEIVCEEDMLPSDFKPSLRKWKSLFDAVDGGRTSQKERLRLEMTEEKSFTYGEVEFVSFCEILRSAKPRKGEVFYDLGSGTGKAVVAAYLLEEFRECHGVELLDGLYYLSAQVLAAMNEEKQLWKSPSHDPSKICHVHHADMLKHPWWEVADVVYTSSICFDPALYRSLGEKFRMMKKGARVITLKMDNIRDLTLVSQKSYKMSWGRCTVYVLERR